MKARWWVGLAVVVVIVIAAVGCFYKVKPYQRAAVLRFGQIQAVDLSPGLHFKWPLVDSVRLFDGRILTDEPDPQQYRTADGKSITVNMAIKWRIDDTGEFYRATGGRQPRAAKRVTQDVGDQLSRVIVHDTMTQLINDSGKQALADRIRRQANENAGQMGVKVVGVAIKRLQLPNKAQDTLISRMRGYRKQLADSRRASGKQAADKIRADAERKRASLLSEADAKSDNIRGEGAAKASRIYAQAYSKAPDFYRFYKSLEIYRKGWQQAGNVVVLAPGEDLLRYFQAPDQKQ